MIIPASPSSSGGYPGSSASMARPMSLATTALPTHLRSAGTAHQAGAPGVPRGVLGWVVDGVGVAVLRGVYVMMFALLSKLVGGNPVCGASLSWAVVLGAGTYFGYTGHSVAATLMGVLAVLTAQREGRRRLTASEFLRGMREFIGRSLGR